MAYTQQINYSVTDPSKTAVNFTEWVETLTAEEQAAYKNSITAQEKLLDAQKASGNLLSIEFTPLTQRTWASESVCNAFTDDPTYKSYHDRYLHETGTTLSITATNT